jgi:hypothetical protein
MTAGDADAETLRYRVPPGQEPVALVAALHLEGYAAEAHSGPHGYDLVVACPEGRDRHRARVRAVLRQVVGTGSSTADEEGGVRFADE